MTNPKSDEKTCRIMVMGGKAFVGQVPPGIVVEITDYDVDPGSSPERDEAGVPCERSTVTAFDMEAACQ